MAADPSFAGVDRWLWEAAPALGPRSAGGDQPTLELARTARDLPRMTDAMVTEGRAIRAHAVPVAAGSAFGGFLDGTQTSRVIREAGGIPIVHGTVAAAVRRRVNRRLITWRHEVRHRLYAPRALLTPEWNALLDGASASVVDTSRGEGDPIAHPYAVRDAASHRVQEDREAVERALAESWVATMDEPLLLDGGTSASQPLASAEHLVGVVKSHRTLYVSGAGLAVVRALKAGERSSVFRIASTHRATVASWYLRLRGPNAADWMWGLVRVEAADLPGLTQDALAERADRVSGWLLAERAPLSLPDARWDRMMYGIRDCEEFLRAVS
jgi:hypothetical protein